MATEYRLHSLSVETEEVVDGRHQHIPPRAQLNIAVGKSERLQRISLSYADLVDLNSQVAAALAATLPRPVS